jgi:hypothetical protein
MLTWKSMSGNEVDPGDLGNDSEKLRASQDYLSIEL